MDFRKWTQTALLIGASSGALALASCSTMAVESRFETAKRIASPVHMHKRLIPAERFELTAYERIHDRTGGEVNLYIEGDGIAWVSRRRWSLDPTPLDPTALRLAAADKAQNVIYLARPCHYSKLVDNSSPCHRDYWTNKRYAPEVLVAYNEALNNIKRRHNITGFNLVGYSGGGTVASLLAAERDDVKTLRTVAGNLDHKAHSKFHNVTILHNSLNPPDYAKKLRDIPQRHFIGTKDKIVPDYVFNSYKSALGKNACLKSTYVAEVSHDEGWTQRWPALMNEPVDCKVER